MLCLQDEAHISRYMHRTRQIGGVPTNLNEQVLLPIAGLEKSSYQVLCEALVDLHDVLGHMLHDRKQSLLRVCGVVLQCGGLRRTNQGLAQSSHVPRGWGGSLNHNSPIRQH